MNRRNFLYTLAGAAAAPAVLRAALDAPTGTRPRPNLLWFITEDNTINLNAPYGDPLAHTPNIGRLAADGIVFENAHCTCPVCAPSRTTLMTGRHPGGLGTQHMRSAFPLPDGVRFFPEFLRDAGYFCTNHVKTDYNTSYRFDHAWDLCGPTAHWRQRAAGQPFFAAFHFMQSHESRLFQRQPLSLDPARAVVPPYLPDTPETRADLIQDYDNVGRADAAIGLVIDELARDGLLEDTIVFYFADHGGCLPRSKRFLYDNGTHTPLVVRFGAQCRHLAPGAAGSRNSELISYTDLPATMLSLAGLPLPEQLQGRAFAGPARQPAPPYVYATRGRMDERYDFSCAVTDGRYRYIRNYMPHRPAGQHLAYLWHEASAQRFDTLYREGKLVDPLTRAFFEPRSPEELFDCYSDPHNVRNLAPDPASRELLERLRRAHHEHSLAVRETGFLPEHVMVARSQGRSPTVVAADDTFYPLAHLLQACDDAQLGTDPKRAIEAMTTHDSPVVRYWGVVSAIVRGVAIDWTRHLQDSEPAVRVAAAEGALRHGENAAAWDCLHAAIKEGSPREIALLAMNALPYLPRPPEALQADIRALAAQVPVRRPRPANRPTPPPPNDNAGTSILPWVAAEADWKVNVPNAAKRLVDVGLA